MKGLVSAVCGVFLIVSQSPASGEKMIYLSAVIAEVERGWPHTSALSQLPGADFAPPGVGMTTIPSIGTGDGSSMNNYIEELENMRDFKVISRPFVFTGAGEAAQIESGSRLPIANDKGGDIEFRDVVMKFGVTPTVGADGKTIVLDIDFEDNRVTGEARARGRRVPVISKQELSTKIEVADGAVAVLGGAMSERLVDRPILSSVPGLKRVVGKRTGQFETLIFLRPMIVEQQPDGTLFPDGRKVSARQPIDTIKEGDSKPSRPHRRRRAGWRR